MIQAGHSQSTVSGAAGGQTQGDPAAIDASHRVILHVGLHDKKDKLLTDIKPEDISVSDAGHPIESRDVHIADDGAHGDHVITFFFDRLDSAGEKNAARAARNILKNLGTEPSEIGVWAIDGGLRVVQPYTSDRNQVEIAISEATGDQVALAAAATQQEKLLLAAENAGDVDARGLKQARLDRSTLDAMSEAQRLVQEEHVPWNIASLLAAAHGQRPLVGRKAIIEFTETVPRNLDAADMLGTASRKMRDASLSFFGVDLNALDTDAAEGMAASMAMGSVATNNHLNPTPALTGPTSGYQGFVTKLQGERINDTIESIELDGTSSGKNLLAQLAESTGGAYSDVDGSVKNICHLLASDLDHYYTITYPEATRMDGRFHPITVKVVRPGVSATGHPGYFGISESNASTEAVPGDPSDTGTGSSAGSDTLAELNEGAVSSDLSLRAAMLRLRQVAADVHGVLAVEVPIQELELQEDPNTKLFSLHVTIAAELKDAAGKPVARFHEDIRRHGSMNAADKLREGFLSMERSTTLPPGEYQLDAIVRDWNTDKIGQVTQPVHLASSETATVLSDLVLVRSTEETHEGEKTALPYGNDRIVPNLSGDLPSTSSEVSLYFQMYSEARNSVADKPQLHLEISKDGKLLANLPMRLEAVPSHEDSSRVANVKLSGHGTYEFTLCLERAGQTIRRQVSVTRLGEAEPSTGVKEEPEPLAKFEPPSVELDLKPSTRTLSPAESTILLAEARERALAYTHTLPNFMCVEKIERTVDARGTGVWKHRDSMAEIIRYLDESETRTMLNINGEKSDVAADTISGMRSNGEFGGILQIIFNPESNADFEWVKTEEKDGQVLQVFSYKVDAKNSQYFVTDHHRSQVRAPFHGLVLIDNETRSVRRLVAQTDALPPEFGVKASWMTIDYDYVAINGHDYLLPTSGEVGLKQGRSEADANQLRFSDYRRFGSKVRIFSGDPGNRSPSQ